MSQSQVEEMRPVFFGEGLIARIYIDHGKSKETDGYSWTQISYDGKPDSPIVTIPQHWHKTHDEIFEVQEGVMSWTIEGKTFNLSPQDGPLTIRRGQIHGFSSIMGVKLVATERSKPAGDFKPLFFQDFFRDGYPGLLMAMRATLDHDTYIRLPLGLKTVDYLFTTVMGTFARPFVPASPVTLQKKD